MYQNGTNTITQGCEVTGQIYMNYVSLYVQPIISSWLQPNYILFFRSSKTITELLKMAATARFMKLMALH